MKSFRVGESFPLGATCIGQNTVQFVCRNTGGKQDGLILYERKTGKREVFSFTEEFSVGNVYSLVVEGIDPKQYTYNFMKNGREELDPYVRLIEGGAKWGSSEGKKSGKIILSKFRWDGDRMIRRPYASCIFYQLHVRGFTKHPSSGVKKRGTFEGISEKIAYFKELGINTVELLPAYEFEEVEAFLNQKEKRKDPYLKVKESTVQRLNYWGFKPGSYFAPKSSYAAGKRPDISFKEMVRKLHLEGIELIMQFYFEPRIHPGYLLEVLRYWSREYHVDGFRLLGVGLPIELLATDPVLCNSKLLYESFDEGQAYEERYFPFYRNAAVYNDQYLYALRHFLKGDAGSLARAFAAMVQERKKSTFMVYLTNYNSFTLKDMVSYERKHNEENGEGGRDGNNYNVSWNCGTEGKSKHKGILALREKQMRNAITLLLFSRGTPVLSAGDEFGNSQGGNNNPYCQDNLISWINWKDKERNQEFFQFVKEVIALRKEFPLLTEPIGEETKRAKVEYPYLSYHGREAWKLLFDEENEEAGGILFCRDHIYLYLCVNMHWKERVLALPNLPGRGHWILLLDTSSDEEQKKKLSNERSIVMKPRSVKVIMAKGKKSDFEEGLSAF